jgi:hypothetical protein
MGWRAPIFCVAAMLLAMLCGVLVAGNPSGWDSSEMAFRAMGDAPDEAPAGRALDCTDQDDDGDEDGGDAAPAFEQAGFVRSSRSLAHHGFGAASRYRSIVSEPSTPPPRA